MNLTFKYTNLLYNSDYKKITKKHTLYFNDKIQENEGINHTIIFINNNIEISKIVDITKEVFNENEIFVIGMIKEQILVIVANNEFNEESLEIINYIHALLKIIKPKNNDFNINSTILENNNKTAENIENETSNKVKLDKSKEIVTDEYELRLKTLPLVINDAAEDELNKNKNIIEKIKIEIEILDRYQYKLTNNSNIMALLYLFNKKCRDNIFIVDIDEFKNIYNKFQELTKKDIILEQNKVVYYTLDSEDNNKRISDIVADNYNITAKNFYKLQLKILKSKILVLDYLFLLTKKGREATNKEITKFNIIDNKKYKIKLNVKKIEYVLKKNLLGLKGVNF